MFKKLASISADANPVLQQTEVDVFVWEKDTYGTC